MTVPAPFLASLDQQFDGQIRCRWSDARGEWHLERKTQRARLRSRRVIEGSRDADVVIRAADGYDLVMTVRPGNRMPCECGQDLRIPELRIKRLTCPRCGRQTTAAYYPLSDLLLEHLRFSDPDRGGLARVFAAQDKAQDTVEKQQRRESRNDGEAIWKDAFPHIAGIQQIGYTGRQKEQTP